MSLPSDDSELAERPRQRRTRGPGKIDGEATFPANRERVIRIAAALFARNGYHATGVAELCEATELSRGSLYYYIDGKETLLYEICRTQVVMMNRRAAEITGMKADPDTKLRLLASSLLKNIADHLDDWSVFFKEFGNLEDERRAEIMQARDRYEAYWVDVISQREPGPSGSLTPALMVKGLLGMFNYAYIWFRPGGRLTPEQVAEEFIGVILDGLRPRNG